ncbi:MAG: hypothetical protein K5751_06035 [Treponemataceae bacterium]|nr:hypothetical protein [Treponemataceae bacterium]
METKKMRYLLIFVLLFMTAFCFCQDEDLLSADLSSQNIEEDNFEKVMEEEGSFYIRTDDENNQTIVQEFKWEGSDDVFMYHFVIEKLNDEGIFEEYDAQDVETNFIDCTLGAGEYRYKIGLYNFLGIIELETDWVNVSVKKAIKPKVKSVSPDYIYVDMGVDSSFTVRGSDLSETASFKVVNIETGLTLPAVVMDKNLEKGSFTLQVDTNTIEFGDYLLLARNEGGLSFEYKPITFVRSRVVDFCISVGMGYPLSLYENIIKDYWYWYRLGDEKFDFKGDNAPKISFIDGVLLQNLASNALITIMPIKTKAGNFGLTVGASPYLTLTYSNKEAGTTINSLLNSFFGYINYQHSLGYKFVFDVHAGGGVTLMDIEIQYNTGTPEKLKFGGICIKGGLAVQFYPLHHFYLELSCDYVLTSIANRKVKSNAGIFSNGGIMMQHIEPALSLGWRF